MLKKRRGQSLLEYIIILTAIVAAILAARTVFFKQDTSTGLGKLLNQANITIRNASSRVANITK